MRVDASTWGEFRIGDLFELYKGTRLTKANMIEGDIRFVSAANINNGVTAHIGNNDHVHSEGTITVCYNGNGGTGKAFYQDKPYWASDDVHVLYPKFHLPDSFDGVEWTGLNSTVGLFLATAIEKVGRQKYGFTDKWKLEYMREDKIKLPCHDDDAPDWNLIQGYMVEILSSTKKQIFAVQSANAIHSRIDTSSWSPFRVGDILEPVNVGYIGRRRKIGSATLEPDAEHTLPLTCAKYGNNGIMYWGKPEDYKSCTNAIAIIRDGAISTGKVYAQKGAASVYSHSYFVKAKDGKPTFEANLFLSLCLEKAIYPKYTREDTCVWSRVQEELVPLPINEDGDPDWKYMSQVMQLQLSDASNVISALEAAIEDGDSSR